MSKARARTRSARSEVELTNHEATAPPNPGRTYSLFAIDLHNPAVFWGSSSKCTIRAHSSVPESIISRRLFEVSSCCGLISKSTNFDAPQDESHKYVLSHSYNYDVVLFRCVQITYSNWLKESVQRKWSGYLLLKGLGLFFLTTVNYHVFVRVSSTSV